MIRGTVYRTGQKNKPCGNNVVLAPEASGVLRAHPVASAVEAEPGLMIYLFTHSMYYANAQLLTQQITELVNSARPPLRWFCIDASAVDDVDYSAAESLRAVFAMLKARGLRLVVAQVMEDVAQESRYQLRDLFGADAFYASLDDVIRAYRQQVLNPPRPQ